MIQLRKVLPWLACVVCSTAIADTVGMNTSATKVATEQTAASGDAIANATIQSAASVSAAAVDISQSERKAAAAEHYGSSAQTIDPCYQNGMSITSTQTSQATTANAMASAAAVYRTTDYGDQPASGLSGWFGGRQQVTQYPYSASMAQRTVRHQERYCTAAEAASGFCTLQPNGMQGADADFSLHSAPGKTFGWDQTEASTDYVKTFAPVAKLPTQDRCVTEACKAALRDRIAQESRMSMARFSMMRFMQSRTTQERGDASSQQGQ